MDPDYVRMVEAAGGDDSELAAIRSELEAAAARAEGPRARSPSTGAQVRAAPPDAVLTVAPTPPLEHAEGCCRCTPSRLQH